MQVKNEACHGHWMLWLTEIPALYFTADHLSLLPSGEAWWSVEWGYKHACHTPLRWRIEDGERLLLLIKTNGSILSRCDLELSGDLMTLRPAHGYRFLYERVAEAHIHPHNGQPSF